MEMMANNPQMMAMAKEQMSKMTPEQIADLQQGGGGGGGGPGRGMPTLPAQNDPQQAAKTIGEMTPEQLRSQATMLRSTDPDTIRRRNPQMAHMTDGQISAAAAQFDRMAANPAMAKMAMEQMKGMTPAQLQAAQHGGMEGAGGMDPTEMFKNMDKTQLKQMLAMVQQNPDSIQQLAASTGISEAQIKQGVDMFANMDDTKMDMALKGYVYIIVSPFSSSLTHYYSIQPTPIPHYYFPFLDFIIYLQTTASNRYKKWIKSGRRWIPKLVEI